MISGHRMQDDGSAMDEEKNREQYFSCFMQFFDEMSYPLRFMAWLNNEKQQDPRCRQKQKQQ